jgi:hypothetical protein
VSNLIDVSADREADLTFRIQKLGPAHLPLKQVRRFCGSPGLDNFGGYSNARAKSDYVVGDDTNLLRVG